MATETVDYTAIAKKYGGVPIQPAAPSGKVDYTALAKKYGGVPLTEPAGHQDAAPKVPQPAPVAPEVVDHVALAAKHGGIPVSQAPGHPTDSMQAAKPGIWERFKTAVGSTSQGKVAEDNLADFGRHLAIAKEKLVNPFGATDKEWNDLKDRQQKFFEKHIGKNLGAGAATSASEFGEEMLSPPQLMLLAGTAAESVMVEGAARLGIEGLVPAAKTLSKLMQAHFVAQMVEGAATGAEETYKAAIKGDWEGVGKAGMSALVSGLMAKGLVSHEAATAQVQGDLDKVAREKYGDVQPGFGRPFKNRFDELNPYDQGLVIHETVQRSPDYQALLKWVDDKENEANDQTKKQHGKRLDAYYGQAMAQSWKPDAAARAIDGVHRAIEQDENVAYGEQVKDHLAKQMADYGETRRQARDARVQRGKEAAEQRGASDVGAIAKNIADKRDEVWDQRREAQETTTDEIPRRQVDVAIGADGKPTYPAFYLGEQNTFGVASDASGHSVYRQTPRGTEWLTASGDYSASADNLYVAPDPATADTLSRLSAIKANADTLASEEGATDEGKADADTILGIRQELLDGEITAKEAQKRAGISEQTELPNEFNAAADGRLNGPFHESSAKGYYESLRGEAESAGLSEEDTNQVLDNAGLLARQQTEENIHHVYRPGDYIISKRGVRWTLDSKGVLHSDDGQAVPLMKRGLYSNDAIQLAQSGRIGYGTETREDRRVRQARERTTREDIQLHREEVDREMRLALQNKGLTETPEITPEASVNAKASRVPERLRPEKGIEPPPEPPTPGEGPVVYKASPDPNAIINFIANRNNTTPEDVMRMALAGDPERSTTTEAKVARLEVGDTVSDDFRKDNPWVVEQGKDGKLYLRSNTTRIALDRLNPSDRIKQLVEKGEITSQKPEFTGEDVARTATRLYPFYQNEMMDQVQERMEGEDEDPEPRNDDQAAAQAQDAERREVASEAVATRAVVESLEPAPKDTLEEAEKKVAAANEKVKVAEAAYRQSIAAQAKKVKKGNFPEMAPATIGYAGSAGTISQNGKEFPMHYELLPIQAPLTSHEWQGGVMVERDDYNKRAPGLQPRTISETESKQNALRAERRVVSPDGVATGYNFKEYADRTMNGSMGPAIVDEGGRVISGNTRLEIMRRHLENLKAIADPQEREAAMMGFKAAMRKLAEQSGIPDYPDDDGDYVVVRMMDKPITDTREAAELGRLFNKQIGVQISQSARGVSYAKSFTTPLLEDIGRRVEAYDGIAPAIAADQEFFRKIVTDNFGVVPEEYANWFDDKTSEGRGLVLNDQGRAQFTKALLGSVIEDTSVLNRLEGKTPYRALERALAHIVKMKATPDRDISSLIMWALNASSDTLTTDPGLSKSNDKWAATYHPDQQQFVGMETTRPPEPPRAVEALWRALHGSDAATPRVFNDRMKAFLSDLSGSMFTLKRSSLAEAFNDAFSRQLGEVQHSRGDKTKAITEEEFTQSLKGQEMGDTERQEAENGGRGKSPEQPKGGAEAPPQAKSKITEPPKKPSREEIAAQQLANEKAAQGYVTPDQLKTFLEFHPGTRENVPELMRTARMMAEYVFDSDPPEGVDRKQALDWILKDRLAGIEAGELRSKRGEYSDPLVEKGFGTGIMKLHRAANGDTFIHEFAHVIFPMLSDEDLKMIDTIGGPSGRAVWDGKRGSLKGDTYKQLSEKLSHGLERYLRDANPTGFSAEVKAVLEKIKAMMRKVYLGFSRDPLSDYALTNKTDAQTVFAKMLNVTESDIPDTWRDEVKKARAEEKRMKLPSEEPHPLEKAAKEAGAKSIATSFRGSVVDDIGRIDEKKPVAVYVFKDPAKATAYYVSKVDEAKAKIADDPNAEIAPAQLILNEEDGTYGVRFNTKTKYSPDVLNQDRPEDQVNDKRDSLERFAGSERAKSVLGRMREQGETPAGVSDKFWNDTYFRLSGDDQEKFQRILHAVTGYSPGEEITSEQSDDSWKLEDWSAIAHNHFKENDPIDEMMGPEVGYVALMKAKNDAAGRDPSILYQDVPERHPGVELEELKKKLANTPEKFAALRNLYQLQVQNLENKIRASYGVEGDTPAENTDEAAKQVIQEVKNARGTETDPLRKGANGESRVQDARRANQISKPPTPPAKAPSARLQDVPSRGRVAGAPTSLKDVKPVTLEPQNVPRGTSVGTVVGEAFDPEVWSASLRSAGLPEGLPAPTWALSRQVADKLIFPGQPQIVQTALSALEQGDGFVVATPPGTGKSYTSTAIAKEWRSRNPEAKILIITKNAGLLKKTIRVAANSFGFDMDRNIPAKDAPKGVYGTTYKAMIDGTNTENTKWDLVLADESGEARNWFQDDNKQGKKLMAVTANSNKAVYFSATPFHSPMEYGYVDKLNLWKKGQFDNWIKGNFPHGEADGKVFAYLDPGKQAKLREQLIERGQMVSQGISYEGYTAHFGVVPVTGEMKRGLDRIHEGFARAKAYLTSIKKPQSAGKLAAFEAVYTKNFLERQRLPQAIEIARKARENGWQVALFSENASDDLFRRDVNGEPSAYQQLDQEMGGMLSRVIPPFADVYEDLQKAFGDQIGDYSGRGNTDAEREKALSGFLSGEKPMMFSTFAAGGIGVDMHDADYPDRGIKGGDKPRVFIFLGPPYSGVLLEQAMGRGWRFGVKSDVHAVFLATDSEPDVRLMQQKVGPRMKALRASVLGEKDSLASVMANYTDDEKTKARQDALSYQQGVEQDVSAAAYQVRSKGRNVGINDWSMINFPPAESAKNKGMKYGQDVLGTDWSNLYQDAEDAWKLPTPPDEKEANDAIDAAANKITKDLPEVPRADIAMSATRASEVAGNAPPGFDKKVAGKEALQAEFEGQGYTQDPVTGDWTGPHDPIERMQEPTDHIKDNDKKHPYPLLTGGMNFEQRLLAGLRKMGAEQQGRDVISQVRGFVQGVGGYRGDLKTKLVKIFSDNGIDSHDEVQMRDLFDVVEGNRTVNDEKINKAASQLSDLMVYINQLVGKKGVTLELETGPKKGTRAAYRDVIPDDPNHMPHVMDWDAKVTDPDTGDTKTIKELMDDKTIDEARKLRYMEDMRRKLNATPDQTKSWLAQLEVEKERRLRGPQEANVLKARKMNHPFYRKDVWALDNYLDQVATTMSVEDNFGSDMGKLRKAIAKMPNERFRKDTMGLVKTMFEHQDWNTRMGNALRVGQGFEAITKMTLSPISVIFHGIHTTLGLGGRVMPLLRADMEFVKNPRKFMREAYAMGVVSMKMNPFLIEGGEGSVGIPGAFFDKTGFNKLYNAVINSMDSRRGLAGAYFDISGFNSLYRWTRAIVGKSAETFMTQNALPDLIKFDRERKASGETEPSKGEAAIRRILNSRMLIGDKAITDAIANGKWNPEDIGKAARSFTDAIAFSENPLQMPAYARSSMSSELTEAQRNFAATARGAFMLQSFSIKTYSLLKESLFDEVIHHGNWRPLAPFLLLYPAAGAVLSAAKAAVKGGSHRALEKMHHEKHSPDTWDSWEAQFKLWEKHPWIGPLKFYIDNLCTATGMERTKRWTDIGLQLAMDKKEKVNALNMIRYAAPDEAEQLMGGMYADVFEAGYAQTKAVYDYGTTKNPRHKLPNAERDEADELEKILPITRTIPQVEGTAHPHKKHTGR